MPLLSFIIFEIIVKHIIDLHDFTGNRQILRLRLFFLLFFFFTFCVYLLKFNTWYLREEDT